MFYPLDNKKKFHATGVCSSAALRYEGHDPRFARVEKGGLDPPFGLCPSRATLSVNLPLIYDL